MENESFVARRTESGDAVDIAKLVKKPTEAIFGRVNAEYIMYAVPYQRIPSFI